MLPTLYMMCGLPGSGKSSLARKIRDSAEEGSVEIHSSDALRAELFGDATWHGNEKYLFSTLHRNIENCLWSGRSAVYDATNLRGSFRRNYLHTLENAGLQFHKVCIFVDTPYEECLRRNAARERIVPEEVIASMARILRRPERTEGWDKILIVQLSGWNEEGRLLE